MAHERNGNGPPPAKRRKTQGGRRRAACQTCSLRKVKCDNTRPECSSCLTTGTKCIYLNEPDETLTLNKVVEILSEQLSALEDKVDYLSTRKDLDPPQQSNGLNGLHLPNQHSVEGVPRLPHDHRHESSRDFSHIPPHKTTADEVLLWPIFGNTFPASYLIDAHLGYRLSTGGIFDVDAGLDEPVLTISGNTAPLDDHRIPNLVDRFLENVHTKNPILDVETLVRKGREAVNKGLGWNGWSCLLLLACGLGLVAKPFGTELDALNDYMSLDNARQLACPARDREQADNCFLQASRRLGGLRPSILAAQCNFFAGVYLMYTLRPMLSWQYFFQASTTYQLYLKMNGRITDENSRLYWSCFKSEAEFRVELPLPQSEIASYDFPNLFPSPPSPWAEDPSVPNPLASPEEHRTPQSGLSLTRILSAQEEDEIRVHAKRLCNEEESWYYYLTEVALRRIGNRIINTFFTMDHSQWMDIDSLLPVAIEFEAQVSTWKTNLPPAMQKYETASAIRAPRLPSPGGAETGFVSRELSWATENRLLEMRQWLYQPFLYYLVHARPAPPSNGLAIRDHLSNDDSPNSINGGTQDTFWALIDRAIDCNLMILETRAIPHRHHGLWFDLRAITCSSLVLIAVVNAGYEYLIHGGISALLGPTTHNGLMHNPDMLVSSNGVSLGVPSHNRVQGLFGRVLRQLEIWSHESPDMIRAREVLESLIQPLVAGR